MDTDISPTAVDEPATTMADKIADMIVREALDRESSLDICGKIYEVHMEIMLRIMELADGIREAERRAGRNDH